jgi:hypothetical protein
MVRLSIVDVCFNLVFSVMFFVVGFIMFLCTLVSILVTDSEWKSKVKEIFASALIPELHELQEENSRLLKTNARLEQQLAQLQQDSSSSPQNSELLLNGHRFARKKIKPKTIPFEDKELSHSSLIYEFPIDQNSMN